jgi:pimeloyl-ACP methyl ester carboxylesterase
MIGMTSYRKTGLIYEVGQQDLDLLWDTLAKRYGKPKLTLLHGESMGGTIVAGMAERAPARYQGALASSAALEMKVNGRTIKWRYQPRIPLLFLSTVSDFGSANGYVQKALPGAIGKCAVWKVNRPGHSNLNDEEVDNALSQLQKAVLSRDKLVNRDGTRVPRFVPSTAVYAEGGLKAEVTEVDEVYGNVTLGLTPRDLARLNLKPRSQFLLSKGKTEVTVLYGSNFSDVPKGGWVIFPKADGRMLLSKNFESAAQALVVSSGDSLQIRPIRRSPKPKT